jgi:POT family proton-dependent oligopeptide transporter
MRNIVTVFLVTSQLTYLPEGDRASAAKEVFHTFVIGVYFFPLLGGWLADRFFGKYRPILAEPGLLRRQYLSRGVRIERASPGD